MAETIIYARRSSESGDDYSLDTQAAAARQYAAAHRLGECRVVTDNFTGTKHLRDREMGGEVWRAVMAGEVSDLVVYCIDRLSRAPLRHALAMIDDILKTGTRLHSVDVGPITDVEDIGVVIRSWQAADERKKIVDRLMRGKLGKARAGRWVGASPDRFGFRRSGRGPDALPVIDPDERRVIERIIDWYMGLSSGSPLATRQIVDELHAAGARSPNGAEFWTTAAVTRLLRSETLIGIFTFGDYRFEDQSLAIIDRMTWDALQLRITERLTGSRRNRQHDYLMAGRLRCMCERAMSGLTTANGSGRFYQYYLCSQHVDPKPVRTCPIHRLRLEPVEAAVWQWTRAHIDDTLLMDGLRRLAEYEAERAGGNAGRIHELDAEAARLRARISQLMAEFGDSDNPHIIKSRTEQIDQAARRLSTLESERERLRSAERYARSKATARRSMANQLAGLGRKLDDATTPQKIQVLDVIGLRAELVGVKPTQLRILSEIAPPDVIDLL